MALIVSPLASFQETDFTPSENRCKDRNNSTTPPLRTKNWITAFTPNAWDSIYYKEETKKFKNIEFSDISIPDEGTHQFVSGIDQEKIAEVGKDRPLASKKIGINIAVLALAYKEDSQEPSHIALHCVNQAPQQLTQTLQALVEKIKIGTIRIFMTGTKKTPEYSRLQYYSGVIHPEGGPKRLSDACFEVQDIISDLKKKNTNIKFINCPTTFNICDTSCTLAYVGFDAQLRPFQIVNKEGCPMP